MSRQVGVPAYDKIFFLRGIDTSAIGNPWPELALCGGASCGTGYIGIMLLEEIGFRLTISALITVLCILMLPGYFRDWPTLQAFVEELLHRTAPLGPRTDDVDDSDSGS
jgi:hypothetical protein